MYPNGVVRVKSSKISAEKHKAKEGDKLLSHCSGWRIATCCSRTGEVKEVMLEEEAAVEEGGVDQLNMVLYLKDKQNISGI